MRPRPLTRLTAILVIGLTLMPLQAMAQDADPAIGAKLFGKCRSCHRIEAPTGEVVQNGGRTGPNLWGVAGRPVGSAEGYAYSAGLRDLAAAGMVWDQALLAEYLADPHAFITAHGGSGKSKMVLRLKENMADMAAFLAAPQ